MLMEWLEPKVGSRIEEIIEFCDENSNDLFFKLTEIIDVIKNQLPVSESELISDFESMFVSKTKRYVEISYRSGLRDGIGLGVGIK
ncbi:MAG: hypothetical protein WD469_06150 [Paenibacillaceae bacterium]